MKRALAERAKQSLKQQQEQRQISVKRPPQEPPRIPAHHSNKDKVDNTNEIPTATPSSSTDASPSNDKSTATAATASGGTPTNSHQSTRIRIPASNTNATTTNAGEERPTKIARLAEEENKDANAAATTSGSIKDSISAAATATSNDVPPQSSPQSIPRKKLVINKIAANTAPATTNSTTTTGGGRNTPRSPHTTASTGANHHKRRMSLETQRLKDSDGFVSGRNKRIRDTSEGDHHHHRNDGGGGGSGAGGGSDHSTWQDSDEHSAFYLKHQNRALATELKSLQFSVRHLEEERIYRRQQCHSAAKSVQQLQSIWTSLEQRQEQEVQLRPQMMASSSSDTQQNVGVPSTGTGDSVEWTRALHDALIALGQQTPAIADDKSGNTNSSPSEFLEQATANIAKRAKVLQEWISKLLLSSSSRSDSATPRQPDDDGDDNATAQQRLHNLQGEMGILSARCSELEAQVQELALSRQDVVSRERRVRRNVYRMAAGILTPEQVAMTLEQGAEGDELEAEIQLEKQQLAGNSSSVSAATAAAATTVKQESSEAQQVQQPDAPGSADSSAAAAAAVAAEAAAVGISSAQVDEFKSKIENLEQAATNAEKAIHELNAQLNEKERRITELSKRQLSDDAGKKLESFESIQQQLKASQTSLSEIKSRSNKTEERWAQALGNEKHALASVDELVCKFNKRWAEVTNQCIPASASANGEETDATQKILAPLPEDSSEATMSRQIAELQHKLDQALENVRQSDTARENLQLALSMNGDLQSKLDELKTKYLAATQASKSNSSADAAPSTSNSGTTNSGTGSSEHRTANSVPRDRDRGIYKDKYIKAKKELAALSQSKESAKAKCERAEKERDGLMESNVRLMRQIGEKDEMNAKSLSTILHLKSLTEKLTEERDNLEQQAKSASQLALVARLATNAKERVSEEVLTAKKTLEDRVEELEKLHKTTQTELDRVSAEWSEASGKMAVKDSELANALKRSEELVTENEQKREEIRKLVDVVNKAEREAQEAKTELESAIKSGIAPAGGGSSGSISVDQLKTQISVLKGRLACPVCHYRDKECIILRCRHMHCKQCVDERISNRSRKCPTCNVKFSENDVGDIWLN